LQKLSNELNIEIRIAHYPPYTSKYNPIEHRLFPHITRACKGAIFKTVEIANDLIGRASTSKGLKVFSSVRGLSFFSKKLKPRTLIKLLKRDVNTLMILKKI
jgi:hypothetical protein